MTSLNNRFIVEPYVSSNKITTHNPSGGFAGISQKMNVKGLKLLVDFNGSLQGIPVYLPKGSTVYVQESLLFEQPWAKKKYICDGLPGQEFLIVDAQFVDFYEGKLS